MTPDQQSIAAATYLGAKWREKKGSSSTQKLWFRYLTFVPETSKAPFTYGAKLIEKIEHENETEFVYICSDIPAYPTSLDAVAKLEATFPEWDGKDDTYQRSAKHYMVELGRIALFKTHVATAPQRLEACLRTLNLYVP